MNDLHVLTDSELLSALDTTLASERGLTARVLRMLTEVEERRLHLLAGHSSLFGFCTSALGMSEGEAFRRITAARLAKTYPAILELVGWIAPKTSSALEPERRSRRADGSRHGCAHRRARKDPARKDEEAARRQEDEARHDLARRPARGLRA